MSADIKKLENDCKQSIEHLKKEMTRLRTGRAHSSLVEGIMVDYYGSMAPIQQLGLVNTPEPRLITIQVYDVNAVENVDKAIRQADLGLNPSRDGNLIRIAIASLTEDRRKELVKKLSKLAEETKVGIRNHRRDAIDLLKNREKKKEISADDLRRGQDEIQKVTDKYTAEVDSVVALKEKEILEV
jgi:ribosome recycling factor